MDIEQEQKLTDAMQAMALAAAKAALTERVSDTFHVKIKGDGSKVTTADVKAQAVIVDMIHHNTEIPEEARNAFFRGEENATKETGKPGEWRWVVDPVDGTSNFIRGRDKAANPDAHNRRWAVSIALKHHDETVAAVIFCLDADATAEKLDGKLYKASESQKTQILPVMTGEIQPGRTAPAAPPREAQPVASIGLFDPPLLGNAQAATLDETGRAITAASQNAQMKTVGMPCFCAAAADVIEGRGACANGVNSEWDSAAAYLLLKQAGRPVVEYANGHDIEGGQRFTLFSASNGTLFAAIQQGYLAHRPVKSQFPEALRSANTATKQHVNEVPTL